MILSTDVGGTFIDFVELKGNNIHAYKKLRSDNIRRDIAMRDVEEFHHGTTVGINALLERKGKMVTLIATRGFDTLHRIGRQNRRNLYSLVPEKEHLPVGQVIEVNERTLHHGKILHKVEVREIEEIAEKILGDSVAVCLINSYANPENELKIKNILMERGFEVFISSEVRREIREYERLATTIVESYISPIVHSYLSELECISPNFYVMQSNGGKIQREHLRGVSTLMSGPAGGIAAAEFFSRRFGIENILTYDMGGTSADIGAIVDSKPLLSPQLEVDGIPIRTTSMDIISIGAGGGSVAWMDEAQIMHVGPQSAGAVPGPACYGRGGTEFTVTDANLLLGILGEEISGVKLSREEATKSAERIGKKLCMSAIDVAEGVRKIVDTNMSMAIKKISISRGYDPRKFTLFAYGGAGPIHACSIASEVGIRRIIVPPMPGAFSSLGVLLAPIRYDSSVTIYRPYHRAIEKIEAEIERFKRAARDKIGEFRMNVTLAMRYRGQGHEIEVPYAPNSLDRFYAQHRTMFGFTMDEEVYVINVRFVATKKRDLRIPKVKKGTGEIAKWRDYRGMRIPVYSERGMRECDGPCIVDLSTATVLVEQGWHAERGEYGEIRLEVWK